MSSTGKNVGNAAKAIERELAGWPGVESGYTSRGGRMFSYGKVQLGHLHGSRFADLPFPKKVRDGLIASGRAEVHYPMPDSGWARRGMESPEDVRDVIELFRMNYERAAGKYRDASEESSVRG